MYINVSGAITIRYREPFYCIYASHILAYRYRDVQRYNVLNILSAKELKNIHQSCNNKQVNGSKLRTE